MSQHCRPAGRQQARDAAAAVRDHETVVAVDVLDPAADPTDRWTLDILLEPRAGGVPAPVLSALASRDLTLLDIELQGEFWSAIATV